MITDWETNSTDLQTNDFGNLGKNNSGNILVGNHAVIFTEMNSPRIFFRSVMFVWTMVVLLAEIEGVRTFKTEFPANFSLHWRTLAFRGGGSRSL